MKNFINSVMMSDSSNSHILTIVIDYTYFTKPNGWIKITQIICGILATACCAPAYFSSQVFFLAVIVSQFLLSILLSMFHLKFVTFNDYGKIAEFAYTTLASLFCFAAWVGLFLDLDEFGLAFPSRKDALIAAGSFGVIFNVLLAVSAGLQYPEAAAAISEVRNRVRPRG